MARGKQILLGCKNTIIYLYLKMGFPSVEFKTKELIFNGFCPRQFDMRCV